MTISPRRFAWWTMAFVIIAATAGARRADAFSGGIPSTSFSAVGGCNDCHSGGAVPTVTLTGPTSVDPDATHVYTVTVSKMGAQAFAGLNVAAPMGVLATGGPNSADTTTVVGAGSLDEITHSGPKAAVGAVTTFSFEWTAPSSFANVTLTAWGNAVNGNVSTSGDRSARITLDILNSSLPTPVPTATTTPVPTPTDALADPLPRPIRKGKRVALTTVASGLDAPITASGAPGIDPKYLYVVDQSGIFWRVDVTDGSKVVFLDVTSRLVPLGLFGAGTYDERGFLGAAFHPQYATNGLVYTYTSEPATGTPDFSTQPPLTTADHQSVVTEWHVINPSNPASVVDTGSARELLRVDKPQFNHNGGTVAFSPADGLLYIAIGDGGGADDEDGQPFIGGPVIGHGPNGNGQNLGSALGKILRIDPQGNNSANGQYGIPASNPFVSTPPGAVKEIYAYGFRNPFRFSFDTELHHLYVGDVGQNDVEEVDIVVAGGNYGWRLKEGGFFFKPNGTDAGYVSKIDPGVPPGLIDPVAQYDHDEGISVIGGYVAHGPSLPRLKRHYVFGEFSKTFALDGRLFYLKKKSLVRKNGKILTSQIAEVKYPNDALSLGFFLNGLGEGGDGEIYALGDSTAAPAGGTGIVVRISEP